MGILPCSRSGCEEIMCDQLVCGHYICDGCVEEFRIKYANARGDDECFNNLFNEFIEQEFEPTEEGNTVEDFLDRWLEPRDVGNRES